MYISKLHSNQSIGPNQTYLQAKYSEVTITSGKSFQGTVVAWCMIIATYSGKAKLTKPANPSAVPTCMCPHILELELVSLK